MNSVKNRNHALMSF